MQEGSRIPVIGVSLFGLLLAFWVSRVYFLHDPQFFHVNHEGFSYVGRLLEFRDLLSAGYFSPQWATHFRGGLGSPYFHYYQPGFFYVASAVPWSISPIRALGIATLAFALSGYLAVFNIVRRVFGVLSGWLAASSFLLSPYPSTDIFIRGDLSEFAAMMMCAVVLWMLLAWMHKERIWYIVCVALSSGALIILHPAVALITYFLLCITLIIFLWKSCGIPRVAIGAFGLCLGIGLAGFYWFPVFFEWDLVTTENAFAGYYHFTQHFISPLALVESYHRTTAVPFSLGTVVLLLAGWNAGKFFLQRSQVTVDQGNLFLLCGIGVVSLVFLMTTFSAPLWQWFTPLQHLQFPWRILTVVTVLMSLIAGCMLRWKSERLRSMMVVLLILLMWKYSMGYTDYHLEAGIAMPVSAEELVHINFAPDIMDEWLPRGAQTGIPGYDQDYPEPGPGLQFVDFQRSQGRMRAVIRTLQPSFITLPHYFFPVGWKAAVNGQPVGIRAGEHGLMRIDFPQGTDGQLEVVFSRTPMRRVGLHVSGISLLLTMSLSLILLLAQRKRVEFIKMQR